MDRVTRSRNTAGGALSTLRPLVAAGAAAIGASLIALTPAVSNDVASDVQRRAVQLTSVGVDEAVDLVGGAAAAWAGDPYAVNPLATWLDIVPTSLGQIQQLFGNWMTAPFPVAQQFAANWLEYGNQYVGSFQQSATNAVNFFLGDSASSFVPSISQAIAYFQAGNIPLGMDLLYQTLWQTPIEQIGLPLENILYIPVDISKNQSNFVSGLLPGLPQILTLYGVLGIPANLNQTLTDSLVAMQSAWSAGDALGVLTNLINIPGALTGTAINGIPLNGGTSAMGTFTGGLLSGTECIIRTQQCQPAGLGDALLGDVQSLAKDIVTPGAQNIMKGGSLVTAFQDFVNQLINGWPSLPSIVADLGSLWGTYGGLGSAAATMAAAVNPADVATGGSVMANLTADLPGLSVDVAKAFDPAAVTGIAASLGPSLAADVAGSLGTAAATLSVGLSTLALDLLAAL